MIDAAIRSLQTEISLPNHDGKLMPVHLRAVSLGKDVELKVQVLDGIAPADNLLPNPSNSLAEGGVPSLAHP